MAETVLSKQSLGQYLSCGGSTHLSHKTGHSVSSDRTLRGVTANVTKKGMEKAYIWTEDAHS